MADPEIDLLDVKRGAIIAPAGCGKTQLIANTLSRHDGQKPILVLTHTNAGVAALRARLECAGVPPSHYRLATIDGFAMRLISTFPKRSGHDPAILELVGPSADYPAIREAAATLVGAGHLNDVLQATYDRLFVDEYQDCSLVQHALAVCAAEVLPICVLGDPMQAIFGLKETSLSIGKRMCAGISSRLGNSQRLGVGKMRARKGSGAGSSTFGKSYSRTKRLISHLCLRTSSTSHWMETMIIKKGCALAVPRRRRPKAAS